MKQYIILLISVFLVLSGSSLVVSAQSIWDPAIGLLCWFGYCPGQIIPDQDVPESLVAHRIDIDCAGGTCNEADAVSGCLSGTWKCSADGVTLRRCEDSDGDGRSHYLEGATRDCTELGGCVVDVNGDGDYEPLEYCYDEQDWRLDEARGCHHDCILDETACHNGDIYECKDSDGDTCRDYYHMLLGDRSEAIEQCDFGCYDTNLGIAHCYKKPQECISDCDYNQVECVGGQYIRRCTTRKNLNVDDCWTWNNEWLTCTWGCNDDLTCRKLDQTSRFNDMGRYSTDDYTWGLYHMDPTADGYKDGAILIDDSGRYHHLIYADNYTDLATNFSKYGNGSVRLFEEGAGSNDIWYTYDNYTISDSGTVDMWIYYYNEEDDGLEANSWLIRLGDQQIYLYIEETDGDLIGCMDVSDNCCYYDTCTIKSSDRGLHVNDRTWHHIRITWSDYFIMYLDGKELGRTLIDWSQIVKNQYYLEFGGIDNRVDALFVDELRISDVVREFGKDCVSECSVENSRRCSGAVGYWEYSQYCFDWNGDGCLEWFGDAANDHCDYGCNRENGVCYEEDNRPDECQIGDYKCIGGDSYGCNNYTTSGRNEYNFRNKTVCRYGCDSGSSLCLDEPEQCEVNETRCKSSIDDTFDTASRDYIVFCGDDDGDGIREFSVNTTLPCQYGCYDDYNEATGLHYAYCFEVGNDLIQMRNAVENISSVVNTATRGSDLRIVASFALMILGFIIAYVSTRSITFSYLVTLSVMVITSVVGWLPIYILLGLVAIVCFMVFRTFISEAGS